MLQIQQSRSNSQGTVLELEIFSQKLRKAFEIIVSIYRWETTFYPYIYSCFWIITILKRHSLIVFSFYVPFFFGFTNGPIIYFSLFFLLMMDIRNNDFMYGFYVTNPTIPFQLSGIGFGTGIFFTKKLRKAFEHKSSLFWHIRYFEQYIGKGLNPKGHRVQAFPNKWAVDPDFKNYWESNLKDCSRKIMELLTEYYTKDLKSVDAEMTLC